MATNDSSPGSMDTLTRRRVLAAAVGGAALAAMGSASGAGEVEAQGRGGSTRDSSARRMPVVFLPHGGGPWPFVELGFSDPRETRALLDYLVALPTALPARPRALLVISAHWEEAVPTVMTSPRPPMLYDYYGFPREAYEVRWDAPGDPALARRVRALLGAAGIESAENPERGFDHGTFVPLKVAFPQAEIPTTQLSLRAGLDPAAHLAIGRALAPLRDEGVLIVGSGLSYHNMRGFRSAAARPASQAFDAWLREAATGDPEARARALVAWSSAPSARASHPREEHLLPLMVVSGAAEHERGVVAYNDTYAGVWVSALHFG